MYVQEVEVKRNVRCAKCECECCPSMQIRVGGECPRRLLGKREGRGKGGKRKSHLQDGSRVPEGFLEVGGWLDGVDPRHVRDGLRIGGVPWIFLLNGADQRGCFGRAGNARALVRGGMSK